MELTDMERLAVASALEKQVKKLTDTRAADSLRTRADDSLRALYDATGCDRVRIEVAGREVGTLTLSFTKPKTGVEMRVDSADKLGDWVRGTDEGRDALMLALCDTRVQDALAKAAAEYGFMPDGCRMVDVDEPARIKGTVLRVQPDKVARALAGELPQAVAGLLNE